MAIQSLRRDRKGKGFANYQGNENYRPIINESLQTNKNTDSKIVLFKTNSKSGDKIIYNLSQSIDNPYITNSFKSYDNKLNVVWGILRGTSIVIEQCQQKKNDFLYIDHAYFNSGHRKRN